MAHLRTVLLGLLLGAGMTSLACADSGKGSANDAASGGAGMGGAGGTAPVVPPVVTGLPGQTPLSELTPEERETLCEKTAEFTEEVLASTAVRTGLCRLTAILAASAGDPATRAEVCTEAHAACVAGLGQTGGVDAGAAGLCSSPGAVPSDCGATVAQYEACLNSVPGGLAALDRVLPACNALSGDAGAFNPALLALLLSPSCITIASTCGGGIPGVSIGATP